MKKLLIAIIMATTMGQAQALSIGNYVGSATPYSAYDAGYRAGKSHAYNHAAKTAFFVGFSVIASVLIYQLGKESCWGVSQNGVTYKF